MLTVLKTWTMAHYLAIQSHVTTVPWNVLLSCADLMPQNVLGSGEQLHCIGSTSLLISLPKFHLMSYYL